MNIAKAGVANALTSLASDHVVAVAADVYDETLDKYQSDLNKDFKQLKVDWLISNPNLDFDASGNNGDYYGYVGNLQNISLIQRITIR